MSTNPVLDWIRECGVAGWLILLLDLLLFPMCLMALATARRGRGQLLLPAALCMAPLLIGGIGMGIGYSTTERILSATPGEAAPAEREGRRAMARQPLWLGVGSSLLLLSLLGMAPLLRRDD